VGAALANDVASKLKLDYVQNELKRVQDCLNDVQRKHDDVQSKYEAQVAEQTELKRKYSLLEEKHDELVQQNRKLLLLGLFCLCSGCLLTLVRTAGAAERFVTGADARDQRR
jgi:phage shock protein A